MVWFGHFGGLREVEMKRMIYKRKIDVVDIIEDYCEVGAVLG